VRTTAWEWDRWSKEDWNELRAGIRRHFPVDTGGCGTVQWALTTTRELGETGLRGWLPCHRPEEPELGNTSAGRITVCDTTPLESSQRRFYLDGILTAWKKE